MAQWVVRRAVVYDRKRLMDEGLALEIDDEGHLSAAGMLTIAMDVAFDFHSPWTGRKRAVTVVGELLRTRRLPWLAWAVFYPRPVVCGRVGHRRVSYARGCLSTGVSAY